MGERYTNENRFSSQTWEASSQSSQNMLEKFFSCSTKEKIKTNQENKYIHTNYLINLFENEWGVSGVFVFILFLLFWFIVGKWSFLGPTETKL